MPISIDVRPPINRLIRTSLKSQPGDPDYDVVVEDVFEKINPVDYEHYLKELIKLRISDVRTSDRVSAITRFKDYKPEEDESSGRAEPEAQTNIEIDGLPPKLVKPAPPSRKLDAIRKRVLGSRIPVPSGGTKFIHEMNFQDLTYVATVRRSMAERNEKSALMYDTLAATLEAQKLTLVSELPNSDFDSIINPALI